MRAYYGKSTQLLVCSIIIFGQSLHNYRKFTQLMVCLREGEVRKETVLKRCLRSDIDMGTNIINSSQYYKHHKVFCHFPQVHVPIEKRMIQEFNGLKVPSRFDCNNFNGGHQWGNHAYFNAVPDRWTKCRELEFLMLSNREYYVPNLPIIDEEYEEHVEIYETLLEIGEK